MTLSSATNILIMVVCAWLIANLLQFAVTIAEFIFEPRQWYESGFGK